jgi:poly(A) polymerase
MKDMLVMQRRFENRRGIRALRLLEHKRFRAAYDFLLLRARCGEVEQDLADWWTDVQTLSAGEQRKAFGIKHHRQRSSSARPSARAAR